MTTRRSRAAALALSTLAMALTVSTVAAPAEAAGRRFGDVATYYKATVEACKAPVADGTKWRVFGRLDNTANRRRDQRSGSITMIRNGEFTERRIDTGLVAGGKVSDVGSIVVPMGTQYALGVGVGTGAMGDGGEVALRAIRRC